MSLLSPEERILIEDQVQEALKRINAAKMYLTLQRPFYGRLLSSLPLLMNCTWLPTMATDGFNIYYNPEFILGFCKERADAIKARLNEFKDKGNITEEELTQQLDHMNNMFYAKSIKEIAFVLEHEARHIVSNHLDRSKMFGDKELYNQASDYYINISLISEHMGDRNPWFKSLDLDPNNKGEWLFLQGACVNKKYKGWVSEQIYEDLLKQQKKNKQKSQDNSAGSNGGQQGNGDKSFDTHMGDDKSPKSAGESSLQDAMGISPYSQPVVSETQQADNNSRTEGLIKSITQSLDSAPEDIQRHFKDLTDYKISWRSLLKKSIKSLFKKNLSYKKLSKKSFSVTKVARDLGLIKQSQRIIMPSFTKDEMINIVVAFDVSGSIGDEEMQDMYKEIVGITKQYDQFLITMFCWSTKVGNVQKYTKENIKELPNYKVTTTGGTQVSCVFEELDKNFKKVDQLIVFTDGYFENVKGVKDWNKKYKDTIWIINNNSSFNAPFGVSIDYDKYIK